MIPIKYYYPENRLAKLIRTPGGITVADALARATQNVEDLRGNYDAVLDGKIAELGLLAADDAVMATPDVLQAIYGLSNEIFCEAGSFGYIELSQAAYSLCEFLTRKRDHHQFIAGIRVHTDAMRLLRHPGVSEDATARIAVLQGLKRVSAAPAA